MARRSTITDPETARRRLIALLDLLPEKLSAGTVGEQVCSLVEVSLQLRELGASIGATLTPEDGDSGRARLLAYLRNQTGRIVHTDELMIVAGIGDYPRRIRELRTDHGWPIISGMAVRDMRSEDHTLSVSELDLGAMAPEEYLLIEDQRDPDAIRRWQLAASIRDSYPDPTDALLAYLQASIDCRVTAEELRYVSGNDSYWPTLVRRMAAAGHRISTRALGHSALPAGIYVFHGS